MNDQKPTEDLGRDPLERQLLAVGRALRDEAEEGAERFAEEFRHRLSQPGSRPAIRRLPAAAAARKSSRRPVRAYWALAAAALVLVAVGLLALGRQSQPTALAFSRGGIDVGGADPKALAAADTIATRDTSWALLEMDDGRVELFLDAQSRIVVDSDRRVKLEQGAVWVSVEPGHGSYEVELGGSVLTVLGTSFAIEQADDGFRVFLAHGRIRISNAGGTIDLYPDEETRIQSDGSFAFQSYSGRQPPRWAARVYGAYEAAHRERYFPSLVPQSAKAEDPVR